MILASLLSLSFALPLTLQQAKTNPVPPRIPGRLLVSGFLGDSLHSYRVADGAPRTSTSVSGPQSIVRGPDGLLYVSAEQADQVVRLDPVTLSFVDLFVSDDPLTPEDEDGPLNGPTAAVFGPSGDLFVASFDTDSILRYDGGDGTYLGVFVATGSSPLNGPDAGTKFGPDGLLYVPSFFNDRVLRYDADGVLVDAFIGFREGNLRQPRDLVFHAGHWYVASSFNNRILRFDADGNFVDVFATVGQPYSLAFEPYHQNLHVVSLLNNSVRVFDGQSGDDLGTLIPGGGGGISGAVYLHFLP